MVRRLMPVTYFVGTLLWDAAARRPGEGVRDVRPCADGPVGAWDGFYRVDEADGARPRGADVTA